MITQAITTNWVWAGSARLSPHANGSCDHYPPLAVSRVGSKSLRPGGPLRSAPSPLNSQELLLDTDTPHSRLNLPRGGGGGARASPLCICIFNFLFHDISNEFWNFFFFFLKTKKHQFTRCIFFLFESSGIKAGHVTVLHHIDGNSGWLTQKRLARRPGRQLLGFNRNRRVDVGRLSYGTAENTFVFLDHEYFCLRSS